MNLSEWQAHRTGQSPTDESNALLAELYSDPTLHRQIVFPGARRAVTTAEADVWRRLGLTLDEMVARVNGRTPSR